MSSFKVEVLAWGETEWVSNALRFNNWHEAQEYGLDLYMRWTGVQEFRVAVSDDPPNYSYTDGKAVRFEDSINA